MKKILLMIFTFLLLGCTEHKVDTFQEWCEQISEVDLEEKYSKPWTVIFSVSFDGDAIRDNYTSILNQLYLEKAQNRTPKVAWREGTALLLVNPSSLFMVEPEAFIRQWRRGIELDKEFKHTNPKEICLYGTLTSLFDSLHIHSMEPDALGKNWKDNITVINTEREKRLGDDRL